MSMHDLIVVIGEHPFFLFGFLIVSPVCAWIVARLQPDADGGRAPWRYLYAVLIYSSCIPGMLAATLTAYALFFTNENLLDVNLLVYVLPIAAMVLTLAIINRNAELAEIPGFDRLWGLMLTLGLSFLVALAIRKTRIWLLFGASIWVFIVAAVLVFVLLRWAAHLAMSGSQKPGDRA